MPREIDTIPGANVPILLLLACAGPPADDTGATLLGTVEVLELHAPVVDSVSTAGNAGFVLPGDLDVPSPVHSADGCAVYQGVTSGGRTFPEPDAGRIHVRGGSAEVSFSWTDEGYLLAADADTDLLVSGEALRFEADGGADVPAFTGELEAPPPVLLVAPDLLEGVDVDRSQAFAVRWEPADDASVRLDLRASTTRLLCSAPDTDAQIVVPPEVLALLPATSSAILEVHRTTRRTVSAGPAMVTLEATTAVGAAQGTIR